MPGLTEKWHGAPVWAWAAGGTIVSAGAVYLYKKHKASASTTTPTTTTGSDSSGIASNGAAPFGGGGGYNGNGSGTGPLGTLEDLVRGLYPSTTPATATPDTTPAAVGPSLNNPPAPETPKGVSDVVTQAIQALQPLSIVVPTAVAPSTPAPPPAASSVVGIIPNPIPNDTSTVAQGVLGGNSVTYGGNPAQAADVVGASDQAALVNWFDSIYGGSSGIANTPVIQTTPGQLVGPAPNGAGAQRYLTPSGQTFVTG